MRELLKEMNLPAPLVLVSVGLFLAGVAFAVATLVDPRTVGGQNVWIKPARFAGSFAIYLISMGLVLRHLEAPWRGGYAWVFIVVALAEVALVTLQSARGRASHHNFETPFDGNIYALMGVIVMINTFAVLVLTLQLTTLQGLSVRSAQCGLTLFVIGSVVGIIMSVRMAHSVGAADGGAGLPLLGWNVQSGDLRVAHFLGLHGLQVMLLAGWIATLGPVIRAGAGAPIVTGSFVVWFALTVATAAQALAARPLLRL